MDDNRNKAYRPGWLSTLLDFAIGCAAVGLVGPMIAWPQLNLIVPGLALIAFGAALYFGLTYWEEWTERKK